MRRTILLPLMLLFIAAYSSSAQTAKLQGTITDAETQEPLISATLQFKDGKGTITDFDGKYEIDVAAGTYQILINYIGYEEFTQEITLGQGETQTLDFALTPAATILNTATVTSGKYEKPLSEVTVSLEVLKPGLIDNTNRVQLDDALEKVPGVTIIDGQANIRGGSGFSYGAGSRVLLLVDDIPILQPDSGFPNWVDIPTENIEQVEVVKGAASSLYGSAALNGIINVRTAYAKSEPETKKSLFYTTYFKPENEDFAWWNDAGPFRAGYSITHKQKLDKVDLVIGGFALAEDEYNREMQEYYGRINGSTRYRVHDRLTVGFNFNFNVGSDRNFFYWDSGEAPFTGSQGNISENSRTRYNIDPFVTYYDKGGNRHRFLGRFYDINNDNSNNQANFSNVYYAEYQFQRQIESIDAIVSAGLVYTGTSTLAELYGDTTFTSRNYAGYLQVEKKFFDRLNISAGFRYESNVLNNPGFSIPSFPRLNDTLAIAPSEDRESKPVLRLGMNLELAEFTFLRASFGQGYRFPTVAEKFIFTDVGGFRVIPNPSLGSETGWSGEIGIKQGFRIGSFEGFVDIAAFISRYQDMIEFNLAQNVEGLDITSSVLAFQAKNIGDTEILGAEVSIAGQGNLYGLPSTLVLGYTYIDPRFLEFDTSRPDNPRDETVGQSNANNSTSTDPILKYRNRHLFKADFETRFKNVSVGLESFYNSKFEAIDKIFFLIVPGLGDFVNDDQEDTFLLNARTAYHFGDRFKVSAILNNIFNQTYVLRPGILGAPRNLTIRFDVKL